MLVYRLIFLNCLQAHFDLQAHFLAHLQVHFDLQAHFLAHLQAHFFGHLQAHLNRQMSHLQNYVHPLPKGYTAKTR